MFIALAMLSRANCTSFLDVATFIRICPAPPVPKLEPGSNCTFACSASHRSTTISGVCENDRYEPQKYHERFEVTGPE